MLASSGAALRSGSAPHTSGTIMWRTSLARGVALVGRPSSNYQVGHARTCWRQVTNAADTSGHTSEVLEHKKYVCADALKNNNKFWEYFYHADGMVVVKYGRVGTSSSTEEPKFLTRQQLDSKIRAKIKGRGVEGTPSYKPPYREITVLTGDVTPARLAKTEVRAAAQQQLGKSNPVLMNLVERLVEANRHELHIATGGQMSVDVTTGIISTPLGMITKGSIASARKLLDDLVPFVTASNFSDPAFIAALNSYLMLVPQKVGRARGWHKSFLPDMAAMAWQTALLDQLDASVDLAEARMLQKKDESSSASLTPNLFDAELDILEDADEIARLTEMFTRTVQGKHESKDLRPVRFFKVHLPKVDAAFQADGAKLKDIRQLWHGTRMFNVLSILKSGLVLPTSLSTMQITGAMFGNGCYFSDQSTKSLNYAYGYWDGQRRDTNCFMFVFDVAMGEYYVPKGSHESLPKPGYDSTWARSGVSGVFNDEMIVYRLSQQRPRYLIEFDKV